MHTGLPVLAALVPMLVFGIIFSIPNGFLAARLGKSVPLWVILTIIPGVNYMFFIYMSYVVLFFVIDKLNQLSGAAGKP